MSDFKTARQLAGSDLQDQESRLQECKDDDSAKLQCSIFPHYYSVTHDEPYVSELWAADSRECATVDLKRPAKGAARQLATGRV